MSRHVFTSSTQLEIWSKKCTKMKNARAGRVELLFLLIRVIVLWRSRSRRLPCLSSL